MSLSKKKRPLRKTCDSLMNIMADAEMIAEYADPWFELHLRATYNEDVAAGRRADRIRRTLCGHAGCTCKKVSYYEIA